MSEESLGALPPVLPEGPDKNFVLEHAGLLLHVVGDVEGHPEVVLRVLAQGELGPLKVQEHQNQQVTEVKYTS